MDPIARNHVTVTGNPAADQTIVFVHGLGTDQTAWHAVAAAFQQNFRIVLLDNVGAGKSDPEAFLQSRYLSLHRYALDLLEVCEALQLQGAALVGHSAGAMVAALAALRQPDRFSRLVLLGASPHYLEDGEYHGGLTHAGLNDLYKSVLHDRPGWADAYAPSMLGPSGTASQSLRFADALKAIPSDLILTVLCSILQSDLRSDVARLALPTLILQTRNDNAVPPAVAEYLHAVIPHSQLVMLEVDGHLPHLSAPSLVVEAIGPSLLA